jgi:hypothetical protein
MALVQASEKEDNIIIEAFLDGLFSRKAIIKSTK